MNAFFIVPGVKELFATHPPMEKRLARLAQIAREMGRPV
jgi:Zn-dependent protease with chaperone function